MKTIKKYILLFPVMLSFVLFFNAALADPPDPPPPPGGHGQGGNIGAPINGGLGVLLALGLGYGCRRIYRIRKDKEEK